MLGKKVFASLILDEIHLKSHVYFNGKSFDGCVDLGQGPSSDEDDVATQSLVFMINSLNGSWKLPIGHFFISRLNGEQRAGLLKTAIQLLNDTGIVLVNVTSDNPSCNWKMFDLLGADLYNKNPKVSLSEKNVMGIPILVTLDACHLLKLVRNAFGDFKTFVNIDGDKISWELLEHLESLQNDQGLHLATKLRAKHINFRENKMKTCLASQIFSKSVAKALLFCKQELKLPQFSDCEATVEFLLFFNNLFDMLNSRSKFAKDYNSPLCQETFQRFSEYLEKATHYIHSLKHLDGRPVVNGPRKQSFLGFLTLLKSVIYIYRCYIQTNHLEYLLTFKLSQDHLEFFFSSIRASLGCNNNPTTVQVQHYSISWIG